MCLLFAELAGNMMSTLKDWGHRASTTTVAAVSHVRQNLPPAEQVQKTAYDAAVATGKTLHHGVETIKNLDKVCMVRALAFDPLSACNVCRKRSKLALLRDLMCVWIL